MPKITLDTILTLLNKKEFTLTKDFKYRNKYTPILVQCSKGHRFETNYHKLKYYGCNECSGHLRKTKQQIQEDFKDIELLDEYTNAHEILNWKCLICESTFKTAYYKLYLLKTKCPECRKHKPSPLRKEFEIILKSIIAEGYAFLSGTYKDNRSKLTVMCSKKHIAEITWLGWRQGHRCAICSQDKQGKIKYTKEFIRSFLYANGLELLSYSKGKLVVKCLKGHVTRRKWFETFKHKRFCSKCKINRPEREILTFLREIGISNIIHRARGIIGKKELDIYLPDYNLAIEYNGLFWHSELILKDNYYHFKKQELCEKKGIELITIWQGEWQTKAEIVKSIIRERVGSLYSLCVDNIEIVSKVNPNEAHEFLNLNHIFGPTSKVISAVALKSSGQIVSLMTYVVNHKTVKIVRFCSILNTLVVDSFSKLLTFVEEKTKATKITFIADRRYFSAKQLLENNFNQETIKLGHKWTDLQCSYAKKSQVKPAKKICRIYDNGQVKYVKTIDREYSSVK